MWSYCEATEEQETMKSITYVGHIHTVTLNNAHAHTQHYLMGSLAGINPIKNGSVKILSVVGRCLGSDCNNF